VALQIIVNCRYYFANHIQKFSPDLNYAFMQSLVPLCLGAYLGNTDTHTNRQTHRQIFSYVRYLITSVFSDWRCSVCQGGYVLFRFVCYFVSRIRPLLKKLWMNFNGIFGRVGLGIRNSQLDFWDLDPEEDLDPGIWFHFLTLPKCPQFIQIN